MVAIIGCESNFTHYTQDGGVLRGRVTPRDSGVAQINRDYHEDEAERNGLDLDDIYDNLTYARRLYDAQGVTPWVCKNQVAVR